jgi:hypothetical protein
VARVEQQQHITQVNVAVATSRLSNPLVKLARKSLDDRCTEEVLGAELLFTHVERLDYRRDARVLEHHKLIIIRMWWNVA